MEKLVEKRREQRKKLNEYYNRFEYVCILCDKRFGREDYQKFKEVRLSNGVICNECSPTCPYCGKEASDGLIASAFEESEVLDSYGEIFLFCLDCAPSCASGEHMGFNC